MALSSRRCSCGQRDLYAEDAEPGAWAGYAAGHYEIHLPGYCKREKLPRWRYRIFAPLMRLFAKAAGAHPGGEKARDFFVAYKDREDMRRQAERRAATRAALAAAYDKLSTK